LIATDAGYVQVLFDNGDGTFRPGSDTQTGSGRYAFVATDVNGDGKVDLVFVASEGEESYGGSGCVQVTATVCFKMSSSKSGQSQQSLGQEEGGVVFRMTCCSKAP